MGKIKTTIGISILVLISLFGAFIVFIGVYGYNHPGSHWEDKWVNGHYSRELEEDGPEYAFVLIGLGLVVFSLSALPLGEFIYLEIKNLKRTSNMKAQLNKGYNYIH
jgi:hypothetical protein